MMVKLHVEVFQIYRKLFNTVNHKILLEKSNHKGIRGKKDDWFFNLFFTNRKQYVSVKVSILEQSLLNAQGSDYGMLLFLLYITGLKNALENYVLYHFADDTNLIHGKKDPSEMPHVRNNELRFLIDWLRASKLYLSKSKTKLLIFHT